MYSTKYVKAKDIDDAATIMASAEDGKFLAGGMTLIPTLKQRLANPDCLVDLSACGLSAINDDASAIRIGAMTRHVDVAEPICSKSSDLRPNLMNFEVVLRHWWSPYKQHHA